MHIIAAAAPTFEKAGLKAPAVAAAVKAMMGRQQVQQRQQGSTGEEGVVVAPAHLDRLPPKASTLLFSLLPTSALLALRCCSKVNAEAIDCFMRAGGVSYRLDLPLITQVHYARFHAPGAPHWDDVSQRLVVELHASRFHLATASEIVGPPPSVHTGARDAGGGGEGGDGDDDGVMMEVAPPPPKRLGSRPLVVGHRGASGHKPGNSLESFHHAVALGTYYALSPSLLRRHRQLCALDSIPPINDDIDIRLPTFSILIPQAPT